MDSGEITYTHTRNWLCKNYGCRHCPFYTGHCEYSQGTINILKRRQRRGE